MFCYINGTDFRRLSLSEPLISAGLSARAYNALTNNNIKSIRDLLTCSREELADFRGIGRAGIEEIQEYLSHLYSYPGYQKLYPLIEKTSALLGLDVPEQDSMQDVFRIPDDLKGTPLVDLNFTVRAYNALKRAGYRTIGDLDGLSRKSLMRIRSLGKRSADEITEVLEQLSPRKVSAPPLVVISSSQVFSDCICFYKSLLQKEPADDINHFQSILREFELAFKQGRPVDYHKLYEDERLRYAVAYRIVSRLEEYPFGVDRNEIDTFLPHEYMFPEELLDGVLAEMEQYGLIRIQDKITVRRMSILEFVEVTQDPRQKDMLRQRLHGVPLKHIAKQYNISPERARQIILKGTWKERIDFEENKYIPIFETYLFSKEEFVRAFHERDEVYHYLCIVCSKKRRPPISQFRDVPDPPDEIRQVLRRLYASDFLYIDGEKIPRDRIAITKHIVRTYFKDGGTFSQLHSKYRQILQSVGADRNSRLFPVSNSYINYLRKVDFLLWMQGQRFRYYEINERDYTELLDGLALDQYKDVEFSSRKFFLEQPDLMKKYDIRDEYELHNLLRKVFEKRDCKEIVFKRMPTIAFGNADRIHQVYEVLSAHSPVSQQDFMKHYEAVYGVDPDATAYYYLGPFTRYSNHGVYDVRGVSEEEIREEAGASSR